MITKYRYSLITTALIAILVLTGCSTAPKQPISEGPAPDITSAPTLILSQNQEDTDTLEIRPGNFNWNYKNDDETMTGGIACGPHPLDDEKLAHTPVLKLAQSDEINAIPYSFSCRVMPDNLTIYKWNRSDLGNSNAQEISAATLESPPEFLELEAGYVYEFTATWSEENLNKNGFCGYAGYVLVTE